MSPREGDPHTLGLVCADERHPKRRVVRIALVNLSADEQSWSVWPFDMAGRRIMQTIEDDQLWDESPPFTVTGETRRRYVFPCPLCRRRVVLSGEDSKDAMLDVLREAHHAGRDLFNLADLAAKVEGSTSE